MEPIKFRLKEKLPFIFLTLVSAWWAVYYQTETSFNDYGAANFEWLYLLDSLIVMPLLCLICIESKQQAALKILIYGCLAVLIGSFIIPDNSKFFWHYLENGRYVMVAIFLLFELVTVGTILLAIKTALSNGVDPDKAILKPMERVLGKGLMADLLAFEARIWVFALFANNVHPKNYDDVVQFSYHQKEGARSNALGFILIILFEMPLLHLVLHFTTSPWIANGVTLLTICSLVFFIAEYRAMRRRPIGMHSNSLIIRYGLYKTMVIPVDNIAIISESKGRIGRSSSVKRYNFSGDPNVYIALHDKMNGIGSIYMGVDAPHALITQINNARSYRCALRSKIRRLGKDDRY